MANHKENKKPNRIRMILIVLVILAGFVVFVLSLSKPEKEVDPNFDITIQTESGENNASEHAGLENETKADYPVSELESLNIDVYKDKDWVHYLLIGLDNRKDTFEGGRSDALMVLSINREDRRIALSSMPRDTLVYINGKGYDKITHSYAYGKAKLVVDTVERNFDIDIKHYFTVNFAGMERVVDALGGIDMELTQAESNHMKSFFEVEGTRAGMNTLTGKQALTYCRIRKIDSDFVRNERQYRVVMAIYEKIKAMSPLKYPSLITALYDHCYTDCSLAECIDIAQAVMDMGVDSIENLKLVGEEDGTGRKINGAYVFAVSDLEQTMRKWREQMKVTAYKPSDGMVQISDYLKNNY